MEKAVLVTTDTTKRGVFFGYINPKDEAKESIKLAKARNAIFWSKDVKGVFGLAVTGPTDGCRVGPSVPSLLVHGVTSVSDCTPEAVAAWEKAPWSL